MVTPEGQPRPLLLKVFGVRRLLPWIVGLLGVLALILTVSQFGSLERIVELARSARPAWLFLAVLVQAATYVCAALVWRQALRYAGHPRTLLTLVPLGIAKPFTDQVLPSGGISGTMLVVTGLIRRRVPAEVAMAAMLAGLVSYEIAYLAVVFAQRRNFVAPPPRHPAALCRGRHFRDHYGCDPLRSPRLATVGQTAADGLVGQAARHDRFVSGPCRGAHRSPPQPVLLAQTVGLQLGIFLLDALTLWLVFNAIGDVPEIWVVFVGFVMASMAATIGPMPIGLGTFEAGAVGMLHFLGVSIEAALAGTLLLRGLTFWLPMLPGVWLARREIGRL